MQLFVINGSSCSGKSTVVNGLMERHKGLFKLSADSLKWSFSDYLTAKAQYKKAVDAIVLAVADTVFSLGYTVICDSSLYREQREKIISKAREYDYDIIEINLEADYDLLETRFKNRVESAKAQKSQTIANTSLERFKELYALYNEEKNSNAKTYRSDIQTPEKIVTEVSNFIIK